MKYSVTLLLLIAGMVFRSAETAAQTPPRLVVVVSFDQHRGDYSQVFQRYIGRDGFNRIAREGAVFSRCYYRHANNITGPGHATLLTGCYPWKTGIVGNDFCDTRAGVCGYCADDRSGTKSASNLEVPTLGDLLRVASPQSKVIGISLKDRAGILMAGVKASACVWFDHQAGGWTTSSAFPRPRWLADLRRTVDVRRYAGSVWRTEIPDSMSPAADDVAGEGTIPGNRDRHVFPYAVSAEPGTDTFHTQVALSPFSMQMLFEAARLILTRERLGRDATPDILCIGVSTPDYVGHVFGPDSREVQELYVYADREIARLISDLDRQVGRTNYVLVITSDHGVAPIPEIIRNAAEPQRATINAGRLRAAEIKLLINAKLTQHFGTPAGGDWVASIMPPSIYLRDSVIPDSKRQEIIDTVVAALRRHPHLAIVATPKSLLDGVVPPGISAVMAQDVQRSMYIERSGHVVMYPKRYWIFGSNPATHGTPYDYDQWVPLMILGAGLTTDTPAADVSPVDIAPTLGTMLGISMPEADGGRLPLRRR